MKIKFLPTNQEITADPNKTLLQMCNENKIEIKSICKGVPSCAECRIRLVEGEHNVLPPTKAELALIGTNYFIDQRRLSCQIRCFGDITVDLTEQIARANTPSKKVRGFRQAGQKTGATETHAKQGIMVLEEPAAKMIQLLLLLRLNKGKENKVKAAVAEIVIAIETEIAIANNLAC